MSAGGGKGVGSRERLKGKINTAPISDINLRT